MTALSIHGITEADYQSWKHHPVSKLVLQYLRDKRKFLEDTAVEQWIAGSLSLTADQTLRGQVIELAEIADMPFAAMLIFYGVEPESEVPADG